MISPEEITSNIEKVGIYNFRDLLYSYKDVPAQTENDGRLLNTLELFAFGGCSAYFKKPGKYLQISPLAREKLAHLSILSVLNANVGNDLSFSDIFSVVDPFITDWPTLESVLISMSDSDTVKVKINEETQLLRVVDTPVLRDAYNENAYCLRALENEDLMVLLVGRAKQILQKWLDDSIVPAQQEFVA